MEQQTADTLQLLPTDSIQDTVPVVVVMPAPEDVESLFSGHLLTDTHEQTFIVRKQVSNGFGFSILLGCAAVLIYLQRDSEGVFSSIFRSSFDRNLAQQQARVENSQQARNLFILTVVSVFSISIFLAAMLSYKLPGGASAAELFLPILGITTASILLKRLSVRFLAFLFEVKQEFRLHTYNLNVFLSAIGSVLLPLTLLLFFGPSASHDVISVAGLVVIGTFYLKGLQRGLILALNSNQISALHLFYYFCALEILPVFVLLRVARDML